MLRLEIAGTDLTKRTLPSAAEKAEKKASFICLQTMWRSCGTYLWSKFRNDSGYCAFIEPCHEKLLFATSVMFQKDMDEGVTDTLRHPRIDQHYFAEFRFQPGGGVQFFQKRFSFEDYYLSGDVADRELERYIASLLDLARGQNRRGFTKFCRFGMKTAWLKKTFAPTVIYVARDPDAMFRSYWSLGGRNSYFLCGLVLIVSKNRNHPIFREAAEEWAIPPIECATTAEEIHEAHNVVQRTGEQALRDMCLLLWAVTLKHNLTHADLILDIDSLALNLIYRKQMEERLTRDAGILFHFDDIQRPRQAEAPGIIVSPSGLEIIRRAMQCVPETFTAAKLQALSTESRKLIEATL
jgi:hypothetical protein